MRNLSQKLLVVAAVAGSLGVARGAAASVQLIVDNAASDKVVVRWATSQDAGVPFERWAGWRLERRAAGVGDYLPLACVHREPDLDVLQAAPPGGYGFSDEELAYAVGPWFMGFNGSAPVMADTDADGGRFMDDDEFFAIVENQEAWDFANIMAVSRDPRIQPIVYGMGFDDESVSAGGAYDYRLVFIPASAVGSFEDACGAATDVVAYATNVAVGGGAVIPAPTGFIVAYDGRRADITWDAQSVEEDRVNGLIGYTVFREETPGNFVRVKNPDDPAQDLLVIPETVTLPSGVILRGRAGYSEHSLDLGRQYRYQFAGVSFTGALGTMSEIVEAFIADLEPPPAPSDFVATGTANGADLSWTPVPVPDLVGYELLVQPPGSSKTSITGNSCPDPNNPATCQLLPPAITSFSHGPAYAGDSTIYYIRAYDTSGNVSQEALAFVKRDDETAPHAPTNLRVSAVSGGLQLDWNYNPGDTDIVRFHVFESVVPPEHPDYRGNLFATIPEAPPLDTENPQQTFGQACVEDSECTLGQHCGVGLCRCDDDSECPVGKSCYASLCMTGDEVLTYRANPPAPPVAAGVPQPTFFRTLADTVDQPLYYQIDAEDSHGNVSPRSVVVMGQPLDVQPPGAPYASIENGDSKITISWRAPVDVDLLGYRIRRGASGQPPASMPPYQPPMHTCVGAELIPPGTLQYVDTAVMIDAPYRYTVSAVDRSCNESDLDDPLATVEGRAFDQTPPPVPTGVAAVRTPSGAIRVSWTPVIAGDLASYSVFRAASPSGPFTPIITGIISPEFTDTEGLACGRPSYVVTAVDVRNNESGRSLAVSVGDVPFARTYQLTPNGTKCLRDIVAEIAKTPRNSSVLIEVAPGDYSRCGAATTPTASVRVKTLLSTKVAPPPYVIRGIRGADGKLPYLPEKIVIRDEEGVVVEGLRVPFISAGIGLGPSFDLRLLTIRGNEIGNPSDCSATGLDIDNTLNAVVVNNVVHQCGAALLARDINTLTLTNNTLISTSKLALDFKPYVDYVDVQHVRMKNNILASGPNQALFRIQDSKPSTDFRSDYNLGILSATGTFALVATSKYTLTAWQPYSKGDTFSTLAPSLASVFESTTPTSPLYMRLKQGNDIPGVRACTPAVEACLDAAGTLRDDATPDCGAYERIEF